MVMVANAQGTAVGYLAGRFPGAIGHLYSPGEQCGPEEFLPYALDNGQYGRQSMGLDLDVEEWKRLLLWAHGRKPALSPMWAVVPDRVGDRDETLRRWEKYSPIARGYGYRLAFAAQDGMTFGDVPDDKCVVFLGGHDVWKDAAIEPWCRRFPGRVHVARVNGEKRLLASWRAGAVSVDGTGWFRNRKRAIRTGSNTAAVFLRRWLEENHDRYRQAV